MFRQTIDFFQQGFTLIELPIAIAVIGVIGVGVSQSVTLNAVRVASPTTVNECQATLAILGADGTVLSQMTETFGNGLVNSITWFPPNPAANSAPSTSPTPVYAVVAKSEPASSANGQRSCARNGEIFATLEVKNGDGTTAVLLPAVQLPAVQ
ncbi:MAG: prepilin-type N-terminal cleavage/methylation domain-containing protein [Methylomonas sp.]|jgi:prepilin-type N-terminal cleavage/methylation domain-containing protein